MNRNKKNAFCNESTKVGIHTGNGTTNNIVDLERCIANCLVSDANIRKARERDWNETYIRINPNSNNNGYIDCEYTTFKRKVQVLFDELDIKEFEWKRIDLSFNTLNDSYYQDYVKLNRLLIACVADSANDTNTYDTKNFWNGKTKSLATKNGYRQIEYYDKQDESNHKSPYFGRLEIRSMRISGSIEHEFLDVWFERFDRAAKQFESVQERFNKNMAAIYLEDLAKRKRDREFLNINSFLMTRTDYIFTSTQMKSLLMMMGLTEKQARYKAENYKKYHNIEYFKKKDLDDVIADIKKKIIEYFSR